ncbi:glutathione S-transferase D5-like [Schistocerca nitens]|uniref:glutathione S-transferase D5-like n=1 Tax=Schistocerca nitens TaxID=7011 RepID=UPI0021173F8C|nr:glutathione S-transferase D5-like [Schistocerca nitens]
MAPPTLYIHMMSPPCRFVRLVVAIVELEVNVVVLKELSKEMQTPEMLEKFPQHQVPALDDNGLYISESRAIAMYLVSKYAKDDSLYPKDVSKRALVDQRLFFDQDLYARFLKVFLPKFHGKEVEASDIEKAKDGLETLNRMLDGKQWLAGDSVTLADYCVANSVTSLELNPESGLDPNKYSNIKQWLSRLESSNSKYADQMEAFRAFVKQIQQSKK